MIIVSMNADCSPDNMINTTGYGHQEEENDNIGILMDKAIVLQLLLSNAYWIT